MKRLISILALLILPAGPALAEEPGLDELFEWMTGSFSSAAQAEDDSAYYDIRLEMAPIWPDRDDGRWIYVEQAVGGMQDKPYRQRVYRVRRMDDGIYESAVFTLPDPEGFVGAWQAESPLMELSPDDLIPREGCTVYLSYVGEDRFEGGTEGTECHSTLRGATYATSEVVILPGRIESWDRGFDAAGEQVWGAEKGAYIFVFDKEPFKAGAGK